MKKRGASYLAALALLAAAAGAGAASHDSFACGTTPCGNGPGQTEARPGCGYGDSRPHTGPPGQMKQGGFEKDQPANPGGAKECPQEAGGK